MPYDYSYEGDGYTITIETTGPVDDAIIRQIISLERYVKALRQVVNLTEFKLTVISPGVYKYRWALQDGRVWRQDITIPESGEASMDFNKITGTWKESEFADHRKLRQFVIEFVQQFKATKIEVMY